MNTTTNEIRAFLKEISGKNFIDIKAFKTGNKIPKIKIMPGNPESRRVEKTTCKI